MAADTSELIEARTEERVDVRVEREEVTLYECPICEQTVEEEELVPVDLGDGAAQSVACRYCARSLFGYEDDGRTFEISEHLPERARSLSDIASKKVVRLLVTGGITLVVFVSVLNVMLQEVSQPATAEVTDIGGPLMTDGTMIAFLGVSLALAVVIRLHGSTGPGRM